MWVVEAELGSCHLPGPWNIKLAPTFMEKSVHYWCRLLELYSTEVRICVNYKCISGPRVARHVILCASQPTNPQQHKLDIMQILCSQRCAGFAKNVSSDEGSTCAVN